VLILSCNMNSGSICSIVRLGQRCSCITVSLFVRGTWNEETMRTTTTNTLVSLAGLLSSEQLGAEFGLDVLLDADPLRGFVVYNDEIFHQKSPSCPPEALELATISPVSTLAFRFTISLSSL
jgi:hypothetical protein